MPKRGQQTGLEQPAKRTSTVRKKTKQSNEGLSKQITTLIGVVIVLVLILCALLLAERMLKQRLSVRGQAENTGGAALLPSPAAESHAAETEGALPAGQMEAAAVIEQPEETLPIIMTNTPTPTPSPTPTATPEPTPTPSPSPVPDLAHGVTLKSANLRTSASGSAKVRKKVKKGEALTVHDAVTDSQEHKWYYITLDDTGTTGWMRDYLIELTDAQPDALGGAPAASAEPQGTAAAVTASGKAEIGRARTNRPANIRKKPITNAGIVKQVSEGTQLIIVGRVSYQDIEWFEVETTSGKVHGYVRRYTLNVQSLDENAEVEPYRE